MPTRSRIPRYPRWANASSEAPNTNAVDYIHCHLLEYHRYSRFGVFRLRDRPPTFEWIDARIVVRQIYQYNDSGCTSCIAKSAQMKIKQWLKQWFKQTPYRNRAKKCCPDSLCRQAFQVTHQQTWLMQWRMQVLLTKRHFIWKLPFTELYRLESMH